MIVCVSSIFRLRVGVRLAFGGRTGELDGVFSSLDGADEKKVFSEACRLADISCI